MTAFALSEGFNKIAMFWSQIKKPFKAVKNLITRLGDRHASKLKLGIGILAGILCLLLLYQISAIFFLGYFGLDSGQARPWTVWKYWYYYKMAGDKPLRILVNACMIVPAAIIVILAVALVRAIKRRPLHGDARFATAREIRRAGLLNPSKGTNKTILVGKYKGQYLYYGGYQFVLLAAPTRSGKGVGVVIPNCLTYTDSLVVLDIKLENYQITSGYRAAHGQEVYLFCPYDQNGRTHRYNPLDYVSKNKAFQLGDIDAIASALYTSSNPSDAFWNEQAKIFFRGMCLFVLEQEDLPHTIGEILRQVSGKGKPVQEHLQEVIERRAKEGKPFSSACIDNLNLIITAPDNTFGSIKSTFITPLKPFYNPLVDMATSASDFDLRDVRKKRMSIYFGVTPDKLPECSVIVNLFFDQLINQNSRELPEQNPKELKYQCLMIMDEFTAIGKVSMIAKSVSYQAGYNMRLLTIIQNKSQLEDVYGKAGAQTLITNHGLLIIYAPATTTQQDANEYSEMLGYQTVESTSRSISKNSSSHSISDQRRALMLPQEVKEIGKEREIISCSDCKPILCDKIQYYKDPDFVVRAYGPHLGLKGKYPPAEVPIQDLEQFLAQQEMKQDNGFVSEGEQGEVEEFNDQLPDDQMEFYLEEAVEETITTTIVTTRRLIPEERRESREKLSKLVAMDAPVNKQIDSSSMVSGMMNFVDGAGSEELEEVLGPADNDTNQEKDSENTELSDKKDIRVSAGLPVGSIT